MDDGSDDSTNAYYAPKIDHEAIEAAHRVEMDQRALTQAEQPGRSHHLVALTPAVEHDSASERDPLKTM